MPRATRIVVYTDDTVRGGTTRILTTLVGALDRRFDIVVCGVDAGITEEIAAGRSDTPTVVIPGVRSKWDFGRIWTHIKTIRGLAPNILHANLRHPWAAQYGILAAALTPGAHVVAVENSPILPSNARQRWMRKALTRKYAVYVGVGEQVARRTEKMLSLPDHSVRTIHNGVPLIAPSRPKPRVSDGPVVGTIARLASEKGLDVLLRALSELPGVSCVLVGDGPERGRLEAEATQLGVADRVTFAGWSAEPGAYLPSFDVFVLSSTHEGFPLSVLEAMGSGLPVVATDVGSVREAVMDGETGLVVPPGDAEALAGALRRLILDAELRDRMGRAGRARVLESFTPDVMARQFEALYDELLQ